MQRKLFLSIIIISTVLISFSCSDDKKRVISEQDADYLIKGAETERGRISS